MKKIQVSIITANLNGKDLLKDWFSTLAAQSFRNFEVILVDNGSDDGSCRLVKKLFPQTKLIINKTNLGFPKACNQGAELARGKYLFFLNNDVELEKTCLEKLVAFMETKKEVSLAGPVIFSGDKKSLDSAGFFPTLSGFFLYSSRILSLQPYEVFGISGVAMLARREVFDKITGFDSDLFLYSEEVDLSVRIRMILARGIWLVPQAHVYHLGGQTTKKMKKGFIVFHGTKSRIFMLLKNFSFPFLLVVLPLHLSFLLAIAFFFLLLRKIDQAKGVIKGIFWNFGNFSLILKKRKKVQAQRLVSDWTIFKKFIKILPVRRILKTTLNYLKTW